MPWPITYQDVLAARERLAPHLAATPLRSYAPLDEATGLHLLVKHENHQPTNAFKVRNALSVMTALGPCRGVVGATRGNHGAGLAWAGRLLGIPVTVCVPVGNNPEKNAMMRGFGARLVEEGRDYDESVAVADRLVRDEGLVLVHSTNHPLIIAGAATITAEIVEQTKQLDALVVSVGGGSQVVGAMTVVRKLHPTVEVYAVQAAGASANFDGWRARRPTTHESAVTFADGMATRSTYALTFEALCEGLTDFVTVTDGEIAEAMRLVIQHTHNLVEGAGAAGLAGAIQLRDRLRGKTVGIILSGANVDRDTLRRVVTKEL